MKWTASRKKKNNNNKTNKTKKHIMQENSFKFGKMKNVALINKYGIEQDSHLNNTTYLAQL